MALVHKSITTIWGDVLQAEVPRDTRVNRQLVLRKRRDTNAIGHTIDIVALGAHLTEELRCQTQGYSQIRMIWRAKYGFATEMPFDLSGNAVPGTVIA